MVADGPSDREVRFRYTVASYAAAVGAGSLLRWAGAGLLVQVVVIGLVMALFEVGRKRLP